MSAAHTTALRANARHAAPAHRACTAAARPAARSNGNGWD